ncbi:hypothetical protein [Macrococcoides canis]|uniref:hypothetical protein n=1 Tax=Macrococcoides canis TaxID=1855823 RepID=UPI0022B90B3F|nr:hypothetical protein [Macrococcus canis]WBF54043.1 hypothetical protein LL975_12125 [Macrococcus canis]
MTKQVDVVIKNGLVKKRVIAKFNNEVAEDGKFFDELVELIKKYNLSYALDGIPSERNKFILATSRDGNIYNKKS